MTCNEEFKLPDGSHSISDNLRISCVYHQKR